MKLWHDSQQSLTVFAARHVLLAALDHHTHVGLHHRRTGQVAGGVRGVQVLVMTGAAVDGGCEVLLVLGRVVLNLDDNGLLLLDLRGVSLGAAEGVELEHRRGRRDREALELVRRNVEHVRGRSCRSVVVHAGAVQLVLIVVLVDDLDVIVVLGIVSLVVHLLQFPGVAEAPRAHDLVRLVLDFHADDRRARVAAYQAGSLLNVGAAAAPLHVHPLAGRSDGNLLRVAGGLGGGAAERVDGDDVGGERLGHFDRRGGGGVESEAATAEVEGNDDAGGLGVVSVRVLLDEGLGDGVEVLGEGGVEEGDHLKDSGGFVLWLMNVKRK